MCNWLNSLPLHYISHVLKRDSFSKDKLKLYNRLNNLTIGDLTWEFSPTINAMTICPSQSVINGGLIKYKCDARLDP